ncbi:MAG: carboxypeptidase-like regulatory domain-containing protein [Pirellulales bacterium]
MVETDANGFFTIPTEIQTAVVVVSHKEGVAVLSYEEFLASPKIKLKPWGRIEGRFAWGDAPARGASVALSARGRRGDKELEPIFSFNARQNTVADEGGKFVFDLVPPGPAVLSGPSGRPSQVIEVAAGSATEVVLGGKGRPVVGQLVGRDKWDNLRVRIAPNAPRPGDMGTPYDPWPEYGRFLSSPEGKNYVKQDIKVNADGTFTIPDVPPDTYQLFVDEHFEDGKKEYVGYTQFTIATIQGGASDEPFDVGQIKLKN